MTPSWRFLDFNKHVKGEAGKSQSGPDADKIEEYTQGKLTPKELQAQCKTEYDAITALFNAKTILKEFKGNALFKDNKFIEDIESLMEGIKHVE